MLLQFQYQNLMHFSNIEESFWLSFYYFATSNTWIDRECAKPVHVGVHEGKNGNNNSTFPNTHISAYQTPPPTHTHEIYICDFCLSHWCCCCCWFCCRLLLLFICAALSCNRNIFEIFQQYSVIVSACFGIPCWCSLAIRSIVVYMSFFFSCCSFLCVFFFSFFFLFRHFCCFYTLHYSVVMLLLSLYIACVRFGFANHFLFSPLSLTLSLFVSFSHFIRCA